MRSPVRVAPVAVSLALLAGAPAPAADVLGPDCPITREENDRAAAAFTRMFTVLDHPRCANCHGKLDVFAPGEKGEEKKPLEARRNKHGGGPQDKSDPPDWEICQSCHTGAIEIIERRMPAGSSGEDLEVAIHREQWKLPLHAHWGGHPAAEICRSLKSPSMSGDELIEHVGRDVLVTLGFRGDRGGAQTPAVPPPLSQAEFVAITREWVKALHAGEEWPKSDACGCEKSPPLTASAAPAPTMSEAQRKFLENEIRDLEEQLVCLDREKANPDSWGPQECAGWILQGDFDEQIAKIRAKIAENRAMLGQRAASDDLPASDEAHAGARDSDGAGSGDDDAAGRLPWDRADVQAYTEEWLSSAVAATLPDGRVVRYNEWAQPLAPGARSTGAPEHPAGWSRHRYLWETRARWTSTNLCSLGEYLERRLDGDGTGDCGGESPTETASASASPSRGWSAPMPVTGETAPSAPANGGRGWAAPMEVTGSTQKAEPPSAHPSAATRAATAAQPPAAPSDLPRTKATPPHARPPDESGDPFVGVWSCRLRASQDVLASAGGDDRASLAIRRRGTGYVAEANGDVLPGQRVSANELRFGERGSRGGTSYQATLDVSVSAGRLTGNGTIAVQDPGGGTDVVPYALDCGR